jgi:hypothetical protein
VPRKYEEKNPWSWQECYFLKNSTLYIKQCCDESSIENCVIITYELFKNSKKLDKI